MGCGLADQHPRTAETALSREHCEPKTDTLWDNTEHLRQAFRQIAMSYVMHAKNRLASMHTMQRRTARKCIAAQLQYTSLLFFAALYAFQSCLCTNQSPCIILPASTR